MRYLALVTAVVVAMGCSKSSTGPATGSTTAAEHGTYTLESLNGKALPTSIAEGGSQIEVTAGTLTLSAGSGLQVSSTFRASPGATPQTRVVSGTYRLQGSSLTLTYTNGGSNGGTLNGATLQMTNEGVVWSYRR